MSIVLLIIGVMLIFFSWRLLNSLEKKRVNRHFSSSWMKGQTEKETEEYRIAMGGIWVVIIMCLGILLVVGGAATMFMQSG